MPSVPRYPFRQWVVLAFGMLIFARTQWISDDGYIYLTYVDNVVRHANGPVFNPGEYVEGFTSVAWLLLLTGARALSSALGVGLTLRQIALALALTLGLLSLWTVLRTNRTVVARHEAELSRFDLALPLLFLVGTRAVQQYATSGLETPLVILYCVFVGRYFLLANAGTWAPALLAGLGPLIRPDLALLSVSVLAHHFFLVDRREAWRAFALAMVPNLLVLVGRVKLYASLLPNTYFAKTGIDHPFAQGLYYLYDLTYAYGIQWIALVALVGTIARFRGETRVLAARLFLFIGAAIYVGYVVSIGGDFMHGRFWLPVIVLVYLSLAGLEAPLLAAVFRGMSPRRVSAGMWALTGILLSIVLYQRPIEDTMNPDDDAQFHGISDQVKAYYLGNENLHRWNGKNEHVWAERGRRLAELSRALGEEVGTTAGGIGQLGFYGQQDGGSVYVFDLLGLTQPVPARIDADDSARRIGHRKLSPQVFTVLDSRVDFSGLYVRGFDETFRLPPPHEDLVLVNLEMMYRLAAKGVVGRRYTRRAERFIENQLSRPVVDLNFVYFLQRRYRGNPRLEDLVEEVAAKTRRKSKWELWNEANASTLRALDAQMHNNHRWVENIELAVRSLSLPAIPFLEAEPDWVELGEDSLVSR